MRRVNFLKFNTFKTQFNGENCNSRTQVHLTEC